MTAISGQTLQLGPIGNAAEAPSTRPVSRIAEVKRWCESRRSRSRFLLSGHASAAPNEIRELVSDLQDLRVELVLTGVAELSQFANEDKALQA